jgi:hypothetical protein
MHHRTLVLVPEASRKKGQVNASSSTSGITRVVLVW